VGIPKLPVLIDSPFEVRDKYKLKNLLFQIITRIVQSMVKQEIEQVGEILSKHLLEDTPVLLNLDVVNRLA